MIVGTFAGVYLLGFSYPTSILLASMFASHTLVTYPIVSKYGITKNRAVNVAIGGTVVICHVGVTGIGDNRGYVIPGS